MTGRRRFTLVEMLVVMAIIGALAGLLFPVLNQARRRAWKASCAGNLRQFGVALNAYANDYGGKLPAAKRVGDDPADPWQISNILPIGDNSVHQCPADRVAGYDGATFHERYGSSYEWNTPANFRFIDKTSIKLETPELTLEIPLMYDAEGFHGKLGKNYLYSDGSVGEARGSQ